MAIITETLFRLQDDVGGEFTFVLEWDDTTAECVFFPEEGETIDDCEPDRDTGDFVRAIATNNTNRNAFLQLFRRSNGRVWRSGIVASRQEEIFLSGGPIQKLEHINRLVIQFGGV